MRGRVPAAPRRCCRRLRRLSVSRRAHQNSLRLQERWRRRRGAPSTGKRGALAGGLPAVLPEARWGPVPQRGWHGLGRGAVCRRASEGRAEPHLQPRPQTQLDGGCRATASNPTSCRCPGHLPSRHGNGPPHGSAEDDAGGHPGHPRADHARVQNHRATRRDRGCHGHTPLPRAWRLGGVAQRLPVHVSPHRTQRVPFPARPSFRTFAPVCSRPRHQGLRRPLHRPAGRNVLGVQLQQPPPDLPDLRVGRQRHRWHPFGREHVVFLPRTRAGVKAANAHSDASGCYFFFSCS